MSHTIAPPYPERLDRVREALSDLGMDAILIMGPANRRYLSGFTASDGAIGESSGAVLITSDHSALITSSLYYEQARQEVTDLEPIELRGRWKRRLPEKLKEMGVLRLAFERDYTLYGEYEDLRQGLEELQPGSELVPVKGLVEQMRLRKGEAERELMREAARIADEAYGRVTRELAPGVSEREVARRLDEAMVELGADGPSFETIVAAGLNSARPHHEPGEYVLREGEPVIIDMGARYRGYCSDMTRSFCLRQADGRYRELYDAVLWANEQSKQAVRVGAGGKEMDAVARDLLTDAGLEREFSHSLGHGVGLDVHEKPSLSKESEDTLEAGMVVTIEPGVYIADWGGIRIEDTVLVTETGHQVWTHAPKDVVI